jgi:hypothetical protein
MNGGRIVLVVLGGILSLVALVAVAAGVMLLVGNYTQRDADGFFKTSTKPYESGGYALLSDDLDIGTNGPNWLFEKGRLATLRIQGSSADGRKLFVGIAPTARVKRYLAGTSYDRVTNIDVDPFALDYERSPGSAAPAPPTNVGFWTATADGAGRQSLEWKVAKGNYSVVVMNADASRGVDARLSLGAKVRFLFWAALGLIVVGLVLLAGGGALLYVGLRRRAAVTAPAIAPTA